MTLEAEFAAHAPFLRNLARRLATDSSIADDLVQETYVAALTGTPHRQNGLVPWLAVVLRNLAARRVRTDTSRRARVFSRVHARGDHRARSRAVLRACRFAPSSFAPRCRTVRTCGAVGPIAVHTGGSGRSLGAHTAAKRRPVPLPEACSEIG